VCVLTDSHRQPRTSCVCWQTPTDVLCVLNTQPTWAKITQTVHGKGQRAESKDQRADMCTDGQQRTSYVLCVLTDTHGHTWTATDILYVLCVLTDTHGRPVCADGHPQMSCPRTSCVCWRTPTDVLCVLNRQPTWAKITQTVHGKGQRSESKDQRGDMCTDGQPQTSCVPRGPKSPEQSTGRASVLSPRTSVLSPRTSVLICVLMDSHRLPVCADGNTRTHTDSHGRPVFACGHPRTQPTWAKITRTVHGKGQRAESKDQRADMCTDGQPQTSYVLCVLTDTHEHTRTSCLC
ncbi:unnamed protein product, partial [Brassica rapa]